MSMILALALAQIVGDPAPPASTEAADARCVVVFGSAGARDAPEQAEASRRAVLYFTGKLMGANPAIDLGAALPAAADAAKQSGLSADAEGQRCNDEFAAATNALGAAAAQMRADASRHTPSPDRTDSRARHKASGHPSSR